MKKRHKKFTVEVVDVDIVDNVKVYTVCVYRWILFGRIPICVKSYTGDDLDSLKFEANDYILWHNF